MYIDRKSKRVSKKLIVVYLIPNQPKSYIRLMKESFKYVFPSKM